tara:strand:- start:837 stop:1532 length:696 start_codon:yes stop_codon:yes gene_type:complete
MTILVSAFIYLSGANKSIEEYINYGIKLINLDINKIIFIDDTLYNHFKYIHSSKTRLIRIKLENLYLYKYKNQIKLDINTTNPNKDSFEYFCIQCNKTEWLKEAIELKLFKEDNYIWIDFGIYHVISKVNLEIINKEYNKVRIANIWNLNIQYSSNIYKDICWYFAGGVFGGDIDSLIKFAKLMREKCVEIIENKNILIWEVNIWYLIWQNNKDLFLPYNCNHNQSIIDNY